MTFRSNIFLKQVFWKKCMKIQIFYRSLIHNHKLDTCMKSIHIIMFTKCCFRAVWDEAQDGLILKMLFRTSDTETAYLQYVFSYVSLAHQISQISIHNLSSCICMVFLPYEFSNELLNGLTLYNFFRIQGDHKYDLAVFVWGLFSRFALTPLLIGIYLQVILDVLSLNDLRYLSYYWVT